MKVEGDRGREKNKGLRIGRGMYRQDIMLNIKRWVYERERAGYRKKKDIEAAVKEIGERTMRGERDDTGQIDTFLHELDPAKLKNKTWTDK